MLRQRFLCLGLAVVLLVPALAYAGGNLIVGASVTGTVAGPDTSDIWTFQGNISQRVRFHLLPGGQLKPTILVSAPDRELWYGIQDQPNAPLTTDWISIPADGSYTLEIGGADGSSGNYILDTASDDQQLTTQPRGGLTPGSAVPGWLPSRHYSASYVFQGLQGQTINLEVDGFEGLAPSTTVLDPTGKEIFYAEAPSGSYIVGPSRLTLAQYGLYTLIVGAAHNTSGSYIAILRAQ